MAIMIIIGHIRGSMVFLNDTYLGSILTVISWPALVMFFFLTGFGLRESFTKKEGYAKGYLKNRVLPFYVKYLIFLAIYLIFHLIMGEALNPSKLVKSFIWGNTYVNNGWYLQTMLLIYLVFWFAYRPNLKIKYTYIILCCCLLGYIALCAILGVIYPNSLYHYYAYFILGVPLGYLWSLYYDKVEKVTQKYYWLILIGAFLITAGTMIYSSWMATGLVQLFATMFCALALGVFCLMLLKKIPIQCKVTEFLGEISLEIYVVHGIFLVLFGGNKTSWGEAVLYLLLVVICTIPVAWLIHKLLGILDKKLFKKNSIKKEN